MASRQPSTRIGEQLPDDVEPLFESIDPDAIDALFEDRATNGRIEFEHSGHQVTVRSSGSVSVDAIANQ